MRKKLATRKKPFLKKAIVLLSIAVLLMWILVGVKLYTKSAPDVKKSDIFPGLRRLENGENVNSYVKNQMLICRKFQKEDKSRYACFRSLGSLLTSQLNFKEVVDSFEASNLACHDEMHYVVNAEYKKGTSMHDIWSQCSTVCFGACYHGGLEGLIESKQLTGKSEAAILAALIEECSSIKSTHPTLQYQCFHGTGHAFMLMTDGDLPVSLQMCDGLGIKAYYCYEGVFMENLPSSRTASHTKSFIKSDDPLYPCNAIEEKYQKGCYAFQVSILFNSVKGDMSKLPQQCTLIPEEFRGTCYKDMAISFFDASDLSQPKIRELCNIFPDGDPRKECIKGGIAGFIDRFPGNTEKMTGMFDYCYAVEPQFKYDCYSEASRVINQFIEDQKLRESTCEKIKEEQFKDLCLK